MDTIDTVFGRFTAESQHRIDLTYDYESSTIHSFKKVISFISASELLDIGANIGVYSVYCSDVPSIKKIIAIEPAEESYRILCENISLQGKSRHIEAKKLGASNKEARVSFRIVSPTSGANAIVASGDTDEHTIEIETVRVDSLVELTDATIGIKIDVEGHEALALDGLRQTIANNKCYIQVEVLDKERMDEVCNIMNELGMRKIFSLREDHMFISRSMDEKIPHIVEIICNSLAFDLRDLKNLRVEKRKIARMARNLRNLAAYKTDPVFVDPSFDPIT